MFSGKAFIDMANIKAGKIGNADCPLSKDIKQNNNSNHNKFNLIMNGNSLGTNGISTNGPNGTTGMGPNNTNGIYPEKPTNGSKPSMDCSSMIMLSMDGLTVPCAPVLVKAFDLSAHRTAVDLGGKSNSIKIIFLWFSPFLKKIYLQHWKFEFFYYSYKCNHPAEFKYQLMPFALTLY